MRGPLLTVLSAGAFFQCVYSALLPPNPCPDLFQYFQDKNGDTYGRVVLENDYSGNYDFSVNMSYSGFLEDEQGMKTAFASTTNDIVAGRLLVYNITFPIQSVIPRLTRIELNKKVYCSGPPEEWGSRGGGNMFDRTFFRIDLPSKRPPAEPEQKLQLYISSLKQQPPIENFTTFFRKPRQQPSPASTTDAPLNSETWRPSSTASTMAVSLPLNTWRPSSTASTMSVSLPLNTWRPSSTASTTSAPLHERGPPIADTTGSSLTEDFSLSGKECGRSMVNTQELAVDVDDFIDGQFPWLVAILYKKDLHYSYKCTGSLVSNRHIITAGHCVNLNLEDYMLVFGKKQVQDWEIKAVQRKLQDISVHPDYKGNKGESDIAILTVKEQIQFKADIKPVCLFHGEEHVDKMDSMQGIVVGWWTDEKRRIVDAKKVDLSIVPQLECLRSSSSFLNIISFRTFCAGLESTGPCYGDNGAGFVMQKNGRWFLRGVMSTALGDLDSCDVDNYFVFVDILVDKVRNWLKLVMT